MRSGAREAPVACLHPRAGEPFVSDGRRWWVAGGRDPARGRRARPGDPLRAAFRPRGGRDGLGGVPPRVVPGGELGGDQPLRPRERAPGAWCTHHASPLPPPAPPASGIQELAPAVEAASGSTFSASRKRQRARKRSPPGPRSTERLILPQPTTAGRGRESPPFPSVQWTQMSLSFVNRLPTVAPSQSTSPPRRVRRADRGRRGVRHDVHVEG